MTLASLILVLAKTSTTKTSSGGSSFFLVIIVAIAALYFLVLRPRNRKMRQQAQTRNQISVGDEVVTSGGILGVVRSVEGEVVSVESGDGTLLTFWRRSVNLRSSVPGAPGPLTGNGGADDPGAPLPVDYEEEAPYLDDGESDDGESDDGENDDGDAERHDDVANGDAADPTNGQVRAPDHGVPAEEWHDGAVADGGPTASEGLGQAGGLAGRRGRKSGDNPDGPGESN
jgi:preprotein translocase subunit YajC